ncbi:MAG: DUF4365 domain-containing protein [Sporolactobacillus sp.]
MLTQEHIKEGLSRAFVSAIAFRAGFNCAIREFDYGIDGTFIDVQTLNNGRRSESGFKIDFQLKSTIGVQIKENELIYSLEAKNYNDLVDENVGTARILIVFRLPEDPNEWTHVNEERMLFRNCAWWYSLRGKQPTSNVSSVNIHIPKENLLTVEELTHLMRSVKKGESL